MQQQQDNHCSSVEKIYLLKIKIDGRTVLRCSHFAQCGRSISVDFLCFCFWPFWFYLMSLSVTHGHRSCFRLYARSFCALCKPTNAAVGQTNSFRFRKRPLSYTKYTCRETRSLVKACQVWYAKGKKYLPWQRNIYLYVWVLDVAVVHIFGTRNHVLLDALQSISFSLLLLLLCSLFVCRHI